MINNLSRLCLIQPLIKSVASIIMYNVSLVCFPKRGHNYTSTVETLL